MPTKKGGLNEAVTFVKVKATPKEGEKKLITTWNYIKTKKI